MMRNPHIPVLAAATFVAFAAISPLEAATAVKIADATVVERDVSALVSGATRKVGIGDDFHADETVRTATLSAAKLRFVDETDLSIGPQASVKLDRFVFNADKTAQSLAVSVGKGALRWVSGVSKSDAYEIRTPNAVLGVRGTIFDLAVAGRRSVVVLREGIVDVCTSSRSACRTLSRPGDKVTVTEDEIDGPVPEASDASDFADRCLSARGVGCTILASLEAPVSPQPSIRVAPVRERRAEPPPKAEPPARTRTQSPPPRRLAVAEPPATRTVPKRPRRPAPVIVEDDEEIVEEVVRPRRPIIYGGPVYSPWPRETRPIFNPPARRPPVYGDNMGRPSGGLILRGGGGGYSPGSYGGSRMGGSRVGGFGGGFGLGSGF